MFHRVEQILQCHNIFGIALTQCVRQWDQEEKIGDVFVASVSFKNYCSKFLKIFKIVSNSLSYIREHTGPR